MMQLNVMIPTKKLVECEIEKFVGDGLNGSFCLLPQHIDFVTALKAGVSSFVNTNAEERFLGHSDGLLVKSDSEISIVVQHAMVGDDLDELKQVVAQHFQSIDEQERTAFATIARLEAEFVRRHLDLEARQYV